VFEGNVVPPVSPLVVVVPSPLPLIRGGGTYEEVGVDPVDPFHPELLLELVYFPVPLFEFGVSLPALSTILTSSWSVVTPLMLSGNCSRLALLAPWYWV
jgi:hypothetical protein